MVRITLELTKGRTSLDYCSFLHSCELAFLTSARVRLCLG